MIKLTKDKAELEMYLKARDWLKPDEHIARIEIPGEGNMNFTLRIDTDDRTFIIKQSRDFVEKYPQVSAPADRVLNEARFYEILREQANLKQMTPKVIGLDEENSVMVMDDLGEGSDFSRIYKMGERIEHKDLEKIVTFAADLHITFTAARVANPIRNRKMRALNHAHIFDIPYRENNGIDLDEILPGLAGVAKSFHNNIKLKTAVKELGERYLADGPSLLHGDYFPGSWLRTADGIKIIDPEFCFFGDPEFEIGVMCAHLKMADQPKGIVSEVIGLYSEKARLDTRLSRKYCATEILRRMMGLAQLPLDIDLAKRKELMEEAKGHLLN